MKVNYSVDSSNDLVTKMTPGLLVPTTQSLVNYPWKVGLTTVVENFRAAYVALDGSLGPLMTPANQFIAPIPQGSGYQYPFILDEQPAGLFTSLSRGISQQSFNQITFFVILAQPFTTLTGDVLLPSWSQLIVVFYKM